MQAGSIERMITDLVITAEHEEFSGVIAIHDQTGPVFELAAGMADRSEGRPIELGTRFATASGTKGFTALATASLIEEGLLAFDTHIGEVVGDDLPNVDPGVTIEQLLAHTSGVGDYLDEDGIDSADDYVLDVPVHSLQGPEDFVPILNKFKQTEAPGTRFRYNNSGFVILALVIERVGAGSYHEEVRRRVFESAQMLATDFHRSDRLPAGTALGYLTDGRTNVLHLPVLGTGDGGAYTTAADMARFWDALLAGRIVSQAAVERMTSPTERALHDLKPGEDSYGLGFWIGPDRSTVVLEGEDAGVSLRSGANHTLGLRFSVIANNSTDVWPLASIIDRHLTEMTA